MNGADVKTRETLLRSVRELWCKGCGYGIVVRREPPVCPMCRGTSWRERPLLARSN
jgi:rubrerythrin